MTRVRLAIAALVVAGFLGVVGVVLRSISERSIEARMAEELQTLLKADVTALLLWLDDREVVTEYFAARSRVRAAARDLSDRVRRGAAADELRNAPAAGVLAAMFDPVLSTFRYEVYYLIDDRNQIVASSLDDAVGQRVGVETQVYVSRMLAGETVVTHPVNVSGDSSTADVATADMYVGTSIRDEDGAIIGVLAFGISPEEGFTDILRVARMGQSGETYAFDSTGLMISESRFEDELRAIGLLSADASSVLGLQIRNPGRDLRQGDGSRVSQREFPLTRMAADAIDRPYDATREDLGIVTDVNGYPDYRGVPVVGAWVWLPEYGLGVATEVDVEEAFQLQQVILNVLYGVFGLLIVSALVLLVSSLWIGRLQTHLSEVEDIGQYKLEKKIGEGGMGRVYRAHHALLRRPTAVKLLAPDKVNDITVKRFEREVRHTSRLSHPNTVAIYDYGRTPDGQFYYAMEYLPGLDLDRLIEAEGVLPDGRVRYLLAQAAGALAEAHEAGLVHRDIKPSNLMLCERGGLFDFIKVLDFGLVRNTDTAATQAVTSDDVLVGTPLYMAPEAFKDPQAIGPPADIYSLGAVAYFLLTGKHAFMGDSMAAVVGAQLNKMPDSPSTVRGRPVAEALEALVMRCLAKSANERPTGRELVDAFESMSDVAPWTQADARNWWEANASRREKDGTWRVDFLESVATPATGERVSDSAFDVDLERRGESDEVSGG